MLIHRLLERQAARFSTARSAWMYAVWSVSFLAHVATRAEDGPSVAEVRAGLERAGAYMASIATHGGWLWAYSLDLRQRRGEQPASASQIWVQFPGTPHMGETYLRMYEATGEVRHLERARDAALALVAGQLESGGWDYAIDFDPAQRMAWRYRVDSASPPSHAQQSAISNRSVYDDDTTQAALRFLLAFDKVAAGVPNGRNARVSAALSYGLEKLLQAHYPNGAWPQRWDGESHGRPDAGNRRARIARDYPRHYVITDFHRLYTFNDNTQRDLLLTLLAAWRHSGDERYRDAVLRGADFVLRAQLPPPQRAWAQQYNERLEPAWARRFEPPAVASAESANVVRMLLDLYVEFGNARYLNAAQQALAWFARSELEPNRWARFYELSTNRPIYGSDDGAIYYDLDAVAPRLRGYAWTGAYNVAAARGYFDDIVARGRDAIRAANGRTSKSAARPSADAARVRTVLAALDSQGRWVEPQSAGWITTATFIENIGLLCDFLGGRTASQPSRPSGISAPARGHPVVAVPSRPSANDGW